MLAKLRDESIGRATLDEASGVLGRDPLELDDAQAQTGTWATQVGLLIVGVASARVLAAEGLLCNFVAGHSVGAFAAAVHAQALRFDDALRLVALRATSMASAFPHGYGMAAITGLPEHTLQEWIDDARGRGASLYLANRNATRQFTISGAVEDLDAFVEHARRHGASKATRLPVAVPSHSPLMNGVAALMQTAIGEVDVADARIPFATNRRARIEANGHEVAQDLALGVAHPVLWHEIACALYERGVRTFVEMAPGDVLSGIARNTFADIRALSASQTGLAALPQLVRTART